MTSSPNSPSTDPSSNSLNEGLAALKTKNYEIAISLLETALKTETKTSKKLQAQMGLILAYQQIGDIQTAQNLCYPLIQNTNKQVKIWAENQLKEIEKKTTPEEPLYNPSGIEVGFVPFAPPPPSPQPPLPKPPLPKPPVPKSPLPPSGKTPTPPSSQKQGKTPPSIPKPPRIKEPTPPPPSSESSVENDYQLIWKNAKRVENWKPIKALNFKRLWVEHFLTLFIFLGLTTQTLHLLLLTLNSLLTWLPFANPLPIFYQKPTQFVQIFFLILLISSPWSIDFILKIYGITSLPINLLLKASPETSRVLRKFSQKTGKSSPQLKLIPLYTPIIFTYGCWPRFARIVVSQGLLDQLTNEEIATLYARELGNIDQWDFIPMSATTLLLLIPYLLHFQIAKMGEDIINFIKKNNKINPKIKKFLSQFYPPIKTSTAIISGLNYSIYWLLKWPLIWVTKRRIYYSDRFACNLTGNPNALIRALLKMTLGITTDIQQQKQTPFLLESFSFLTPIGIKQAITLGTLIPTHPIEPLLQWDINNPGSQWLNLNQTHPLLGERLQILCLYSQYGKVDTELDLLNQPPKPSPKKKPIHPLYTFVQKLIPPRSLLLQGAPFLGIPMGLLMVSLIWGFAGILSELGLWQLQVLSGDVGIVFGCLPIGFSVGTLMRINPLFPDIKPFQLKNLNLSQSLTDPNALPTDSQTVRLKGELLGHQGSSNWLGQDLLLKTPQGLIPLHHVSRFGPLGNLWPFLPHPSEYIGQSVTVVGWFRRGATPWIDVDNIQTDKNQCFYSHHPFWSTLLALLTAIWGAYLIIQTR